MWPSRANQARWFTSPWGSRYNAGTAGITTVGDAYLLPLIGYQAATIEAMGIYKTTAVAATTVLRLAIYNSDSNGKPTTVLTEFGTPNLNVASSGIKSVGGTASVVKDEVYWLAVKRDSGSTTPAICTHETAAGEPPGMWFPYGWDSSNFTGLIPNGPAHARALLYPTATTGIGSGAYATLSSYTPTLSTDSFPMVWFTFEFTPEGAAGWAWNGAQPFWQTIG